MAKDVLVVWLLTAAFVIGTMLLMTHLESPARIESGEASEFPAQGYPAGHVWSDK